MVIYVENENLESNIPLGLLFSIINNNKALNYYSNLDTTQKENITKYIQNVTDSNEVKAKINEVIDHLENKDLNFL